MLTDGVQASLRNAERQQELDQRIVPGIPSDVQFLYIGLMVIGLLGLPVVAPLVAAHLAAGAGRRVCRSAAATGPRGSCAAPMFLFIFLPLAAQPALVVHIVQSIWQLVTTPVRWWRWLTGRRAPAGAG